jgi:hypothetical protein
MSTLIEHVDEYLRARRALGVKLERAGRLLPQLVSYLEAAQASTITRELALSWAQLPADAHPQYWASRLSIARGFAAYLQTIDPSTEIPPAGCSPSGTSAQRHTCGPGRTSPDCSKQRGRCGRC